MKKRHRRIVLDLRPLQTGYAGRGIGRYTRELASRLAAQAANRPELGELELRSLVFAGSPPPISDIRPLIRAPRVRRPWLWDQLALPMHLGLNRVDLFHNFVAMGPLHEISYPLAFASRTLATLHDWHMFRQDASPLERFYRSTRRIRLQRMGLGGVGHLAFDAPHVLEETLRNSGLRPERCTVIAPGGDHLPPVAAANATRPYALSIGDTLNKNLPLAFAAVRAAREHHPSLDWVVCGGRRRVAESLGEDVLSRNPWVRIEEDAHDLRLSALYGGAVCLLFPSLEEGFGIPFLEAMHAGCPALASDIPSLAFIAGGREKLLPPSAPQLWAEALGRMLRDEAYRSRAIAWGRTRASGFTWDRCATATFDLYGRLLGTGTR